MIIAHPKSSDKAPKKVIEKPSFKPFRELVFGHSSCHPQRPVLHGMQLLVARTMKYHLNDIKQKP